LGRIFKTIIKDNRKIASNHYILTLHPLKKITRPEPGQFFMVSIGNGLDPLLRRPFSIYRWLGGDFQILYRIVGKGTSILKEKKAGETLEILGPLGNGFPIVRGRNQEIILLAGGLGIASIFALVEANKERSPILFYGARTKKDLLCLGELKAIGIKTVISTDDGSRGHRGSVLEPFKEFLSIHASRITHYCFYACGPRPMLREISDIAREYELKGYISLEENMACGVGTCLGCAVNTRERYKRVCREGPVFSAEDIIW
jgi:dihydroorotate dehydrogenase electron transfer subunit